MMKIGFLLPLYHPYKGGAENVFKEMAEEFAKRHEVHVFTSNNPSLSAKAHEVVNGVNVHRYKTWASYRTYLSFYPGVVQAVLKQDLDILHVSGF
jgi:glycosyltransferase involved in cell wall biosynthesis